VVKEASESFGSVGRSMRCSKCGFENPGGMKFCGQCTAPLALVCPKCRFENPPGFKFCGQCTAPLSASEMKAAPSIRMGEPAADAEALESERKTVTALFAAIKGSTELIRELDPEEARALIDPALKLMIDAVRRYGGYIVQSTGDGIFALFGAPVAHEDHPQRALYAALRMQDEIRRYADRQRAEGRAPIQIRVGSRGWREQTAPPPLSTIAFSAGLLDSTGTGHPPAGTGLTVLCAPNNPRRQEGSRPWELTRFFLCQRDSDRSWDQSAAHTLMDVLDGLRR
jgi:Adenylate and Guanylate cyclase catalytic domain/Double zinc ribbon